MSECEQDTTNQAPQEIVLNEDTRFVFGRSGITIHFDWACPNCHRRYSLKNPEGKPTVHFEVGMKIKHSKPGTGKRRLARIAKQKREAAREAGRAEGSVTPSLIPPELLESSTPRQSAHEDVAPNAVPVSPEDSVTKDEQ